MYVSQCISIRNESQHMQRTIKTVHTRT